MARLTVVGVGLKRGDMTFAAAEALCSGARVILHTERIECADYLREKGIPFDTLDALYEECDDFEQHALKAAEAVMKAAEGGETVYAVYDIRDRSILKLRELGAKFDTISGVPTEAELLSYADGAVRMYEASDWESMHLSARENALIREIDTRELAGEVKLKLMDCYPDETRVYLRFGDGRIARVPLYDMDRLKGYDHRCCALVPAVRDLTQLERFGMDDFKEIMHILQGENGCAWDRIQTHETLRRYLLEETYEALEAIDAGDPQHICEELGDILMQIVMHAEIASKHGEFSLEDVITGVAQKMIDRHTHVFGQDKTQDAEEVLNIWTRNKMKERGQQSFAEVLKEVSHSLPALLRGVKICEKSVRAGVGPEDVRVLTEDVRRLIESFEAEPCEETAGDLLFMLCMWMSMQKIEPELSLNAAENRYIERFETFEQNLLEQNMTFEKHSYWDSVKSGKMQ